MKRSPGKLSKRQGFALRMLVAALLATNLTAAVAASGDDFVLGYLTALLEREFKWERGSYRLEVLAGVATITLSEADSRRAAEALDRIGEVDGMSGLNIVTAEAPGAEADRNLLRYRIYEVLNVLPEIQTIPAYDLFSPLIADPKEPRFFMSARAYRTSVDTVNIAAVGFGESFGLYRRPGKHPGDGLQVSI